MNSLRDIQNDHYQFIKSRKWDRFNKSQVFTHLIEEIGELGSLILYEEQYKVEGAGHKRTASNVSQEFAQVFSLFLQLASSMEVDLESAWHKEFSKMEERFNQNQWEKLAKD